MRYIKVNGHPLTIRADDEADRDQPAPFGETPDCTETQASEAAAVSRDLPKSLPRPVSDILDALLRRSSEGQAAVEDLWEELRHELVDDAGDELSE